MLDIRRLQPHDPLPDGRGARVTVLRRFDEDDPARVVDEITLHRASGEREMVETSQPSFDAALAAGRKVAESEGVGVVYAVDRTAGPLEQEVVGRHGDHGFRGRALDDVDPDAAP